MTEPCRRAGRRESNPCNQVCGLPWLAYGTLWSEAWTLRQRMVAASGTATYLHTLP